MENSEKGIRIRVRNEFLDDSIPEEAKVPRENCSILKSLANGDSRGNTRTLSNRSEPKHAEVRKRAEELYSEVGGTPVEK